MTEADLEFVTVLVRNFNSALAYLTRRVEQLERRVDRLALGAKADDVRS